MMHGKAMLISSMLVLMLVLTGCGPSAEEQKAVKAFDMLERSHIGLSLSKTMIINERDGYLEIAIPEYYFADKEPVPHDINVNTYRSEDHGPMLFVFRDDKLYSANDMAKIYAPELEHMKLP